jgi:hypothetical protein
MNGDDEINLYDEDGTLRYVPAPKGPFLVTTKRLSINMPLDLHHRFKVACARADLVMVAEVVALIERRTAEIEKS